MKYLITRSEFQPAIVIGHDVGHEALSKALICRPYSAGHFEVKDGMVRTYDKSIAFNMYPRKRDASLLAAYLGLGYDKVHPDCEFIPDEDEQA